MGSSPSAALPLLGTEPSLHGWGAVAGAVALLRARLRAGRRGCVVWCRGYSVECKKEHGLPTHPVHAWRGVQWGCGVCVWWW